MATQSSSTSTPTGTGYSPLRGEPTMGSVPIPTLVVTTIAAAATATITAAQMLGGLVLQAGISGGTTSTFDTAANIIAAIPGAAVNSSFQFDILNTAASAYTITVAGGTGVTTATGATLTIAYLTGKRFLVLVTELPKSAAGITQAPAVTIYSLGTYVF